MPDIFKLLRADHDRIRDLILEIGQTVNGDWEKREQLYNELRLEVANHAKFEDEVAFPRIREELNHETAMMVDDEQDEHTQIGFLIAKLETLKPKSPKWQETIEQLEFLFDRHARNEEVAFFPYASQQLPQQTSTELARLYLEQREPPKR